MIWSLILSEGSLCGPENPEKGRHVCQPARFCLQHFESICNEILGHSTLEETRNLFKWKDNWEGIVSLALACPKSITGQVIQEDNLRM